MNQWPKAGTKQGRLNALKWVHPIVIRIKERQYLASDASSRELTASQSY